MQNNFNSNSQTARQPKKDALKYKQYFPKGTRKQLQRKHTQKKNNTNSNPNIFKLVKKKINSSLEIELSQIIADNNEFNPIDTLMSCLLFLNEKHPKILKKITFNKKLPILETISKTLKNILTNDIQIEITGKEISFIETTETCIDQGYLLYVDYIEQINQPILKKAYANIILEFKNHFENHLDINTPIEKIALYKHDFDSYVEWVTEDENVNEIQLFKQTNKTINHFKNQLKILKDENWLELLTQYTPTNDTDTITKQIFIQSREIYSQVVRNFSYINIDIQDDKIHFQELFRIFFVGDELDLEKHIITSIDDRINNYGLTQPKKLTTYSKQKKIGETSYKNIQKLENLTQYINKLNNHLNQL